jgi:uncharacterized protein (DUF849 family)
MDKLIITCAVTGSTNIPSLNPNLPLTHREIADSAVAAAQAGAAVLHIHTRRDADGHPSFRVEDYRPILTSIKARCGAVIGITTPGSPALSQEDRLAHIGALKPELCSCLPGSVNYALHPRARAVTAWRHDWERPFLEASRDGLYRSTFADLERIGALCREHRVKPSWECFDLGHLYNLAFLLEEGLIDPPVHLELVLGALGGVGAEADVLVFLRNKAEALFGRGNFTWSTCGLLGPAAFTLAPLAISLGGHVRVGLEDTTYLRPGVLAESNAQMVAQVAALARACGREIAGPDEARSLLGLKGGDQAGF